MTVLTKRKPEASRLKRITSIVAILLVSILAMIAIGAGAFALSVVSTIDSAGRLSKSFDLDSVRPAPTVPSSSGTSAQNILVLGTDLRGAAVGEIESKAPQLLDTAMIVHVSEDRGSIQVLSFRRDTIFEIPRHGEGKLNFALQKGGVSLVVHTFENLTDVRIDHVAMVDFTTVASLTNALDGVVLSNKESFEAAAPAGLHFDKGAIALDGDQALAYVREAKAFVGDSNSPRLENQKRYLGAVLTKLLSESVLTNPMKLSSVLRAVAKGSRVDSGLNSRYILELGYELRGLSVDDIRFIDYPISNRVRVSNEWGVQPVAKEAAKLNRALREDSLVSYAP